MAKRKHVDENEGEGEDETMEGESKDSFSATAYTNDAATVQKLATKIQAILDDPAAIMQNTMTTSSLQESGNAVLESIRDVYESQRKEALSTMGINEEKATEYIQTQMLDALRTALIRSQDKIRTESPGKLLDISVAMAQAQICPIFAPFILLEDMFAIETTQRYEDFWQLLEQRRDVLTNRFFLPDSSTAPSRLALLRIAKLIMNRVSQAHHTVLSGKVMMLLAYTFPLSERSAVNVLGTYNEGNATEVESLDAFQEARKPTTVDIDGNDTSDIDYTLYQSFWKLQEDFANKPDAEGRGCVSRLDMWKAFESRVDTVLKAFEAMPFSRADLDRELEARKKQKASVIDEIWQDTTQAAEDGHEQMKDNTNAEQKAHEFFPTKYLSSSKLLKLELSDAKLRRNVLCQCLILFRKISTDAMLQSMPNDVGVIVKQVTPILSNRVVRLLRETPPDGSSFVNSIDNILKREAHWQEWKDKKCPPFERKAEEDPEVEKRRNQLDTKRKKEFLRIKSIVSENCKLWKWSVNNWMTDLAMPERKSTPDAMEFVKPMMDAIDPENCIEEAYHPKHDELFCWRGIRVLYREIPDCLESTDLGSLENTCIRLSKNQSASEGNQATKDQEADDKEEEKKDNNDHGNKAEDGENMEDVPEVKQEAEEEQKAENSESVSS